MSEQAYKTVYVGGVGEIEEKKIQIYCYHHPDHI